MNLITDNTPCPEAEGTNANHAVKLQSYGHCINCGKKVGPDVSPIKVPVVVYEQLQADRDSIPADLREAQEKEED